MADIYDGSVIYGSDPCPPAEFKAKKAIVDSDFDGVVSGSILKYIFPEIQVYFSDPSAVQAGKMDDLIDEYTISADLPYRAGVGLYLDHHESGRPTEKSEFPGRWMNFPSAAHVVYSYFGNAFDLSKFSELIPYVDKFDFGLITLQEVVNPHPFIALALCLQNQGAQINERLVNLMSKHSSDFSDLWSDDKIRKFMNRRQTDLSRAKSEIMKNSQIEDRIVFVDMRTMDRINIHSFNIFAIYPNVEVLVLIKNREDSTIVTMYFNCLNPKSRDVNLLQIVREINPLKSGGHQHACGMTLPENVSVPEMQKFVSQKIHEQWASIQ